MERGRDEVWRALIRETTNIARAAIDPDTPIESVLPDDAAILGLVSALEREFGIVLPDDLLGSLVTFGDLEHYVETVGSHK